MPARKPSVKKSLYLAACAAVFLTPGCTADNGPWPMPTGYTYQHGKYKAPPGPEPTVDHSTVEHEVGAATPAAAPSTVTETTQTTTTTTIVAAPDSNTVPAVTSETIPALDAAPSDATAAANDLVARLAADFGQPTDAIWVQAAMGSPLNAEFATALRAALESHSLHTASAPGEGTYSLRYELGDGSATVTLMSGPNQVAQESTAYSVPAAPAPAASTPALQIIEPSPTGEAHVPDPPPGDSTGAPVPLMP